MGTQLTQSERVIAVFDSFILNRNYNFISKLSKNQEMLPMIKANGYGHGAVWIGKLLKQRKNLFGLGVATLSEAQELRENVLGKYRILVLSGTSFWTEEKGRFCQKFGLTPVISSTSDWNKFLRQGWPKKLHYHLKFNTGMNRLGIGPSQTESIIRQLKKKDKEWQPEGVLSHLAMGENPGHRLSKNQLAKYTFIRNRFKVHSPDIRCHLANSAGIWNHSDWKLDSNSDLVRPGLSLYGVPPWHGAPPKGIRPVATLKMIVLAVHSLIPGDRVGYGGTFIAKKRQKVAILGGGYGDGIPRSMTESGNIFLRGKFLNFAGRVSMDLCAIECSKNTQPGDWVEFLGPHINPWEQAISAGTIPYELLTSISKRVRRNYE